MTQASWPQLLLQWYKSQGRRLPWRTDRPQPYAVWVSEIMLQQTRVETVIPYYERWMAAFPTVAALAAAEEDRVMKLWEGLGYYSRCRNLRRGAQYVQREYGENFPESYEAWLAVPGVGSYTAAAICSIALGLPEPAVDGNLLRIGARVFLCADNVLDEKTKKTIRAAFLPLMPPEAPGDFNQALMDLGADICLPGDRARCMICPIQSACQAFACGRTAELPLRLPRQKKTVEQRTVLLLTDGEHCVLRRRPERGILAGLYEFPNLPGWLTEAEVLRWLKAQRIEVEQLERMAEQKHVFTHLIWELRPYKIRLSPLELQACLHRAEPEGTEPYHAAAHAAVLSERGSGHAGIAAERDGMCAGMPAERGSGHAGIAAERDGMCAGMPAERGSGHAEETVERNGACAETSAECGSEHVEAPAETVPYLKNTEAMLFSFSTLRAHCPLPTAFKKFLPLLEAGK